MSVPLFADAENRKLRGGYYTPAPIAQFLADWAIRSRRDNVLEPSCGDGEILGAAARRLQELGATPSEVNGQLRAVELYESEAVLACERLERLAIPSRDVVSVRDFFSDDAASKCDVVVGNPPFLRYHSFPEDQRERAFRIMRTAGLNPTKLTNSWAAFLIAACLRLKGDGRLAMVIPAELLQVKYAAPTRDFLAQRFGAITIITFRRLVFAGIQQEVVLLLAEKSPEIESGIDVIELGDADDLEGYEVKLRARRHLKAIDHADEKWTQYYLEEDEIALLRAVKQHPQLVRLGQLGSVDVGVVTGDNSFFVLNEDQAHRLGLMAYTLPLVGRTAQLPGLQYADEDWAANCQAQVLCRLLNLPPVPPAELPEAAQAYIQSGEARGAHAGYICRIRKSWYTVPSLWSPDAFLFRQIHEYPKLVHNTTSATSTDTIHRVRFHQPQHAAQLSLAFMNSMTFAFSEVFGRSYGGGVLELEPNEAEQIPLPFFADASLDFGQLDRLERAKQIDALLDITDAELLGKRMGFDKADVKLFRR
ncbi:MAG: SAM-dependent methyltransferase, partial [Armatimonadota bacterium]|nr:SAM-dependent methyltransferase [Armatimonadota bacterium]